LYINGLLVALSKAGVVCFIGDNFVGALAYVNDIQLYTLSASVLRIILVICDDYANEYSISFNATKSKCLVVLPDIRYFLHDSLNNCSFYISNNPIEYVDSFALLGYVNTNQLNDTADILQWRNDFFR